MPREGRVVMLAGPGESTNILFHALVAAGFEVDTVVIERPVSARQLLERRLKKLGAATVVGQVLFRAGIAPLLQASSRRRIAAIKRTHRLDDSPIDAARVRHVETVNSDEVIAFLAEKKPRVVVVSGTRIVAGRVIRSTTAPFVNVHAGITPMYRGVHGAYWAMVDGRPDLAGVTVHLVDEGIDTGRILGQARVEPHPDDNYATFPLLQLAAGLPLLVDALDAILADRAVVKPYPDGSSTLRSHPTAWGYVAARLRGVK